MWITAFGHTVGVMQLMMERLLYGQIDFQLADCLVVSRSHEDFEGDISALAMIPLHHDTVLVSLNSLRANPNGR